MFDSTTDAGPAVATLEPGATTAFAPGPERLLPTAAHLLHLPGGDWRVWRPVVLRGAGFPAGMVLSLAAPRTSAAADAYLRAQLEVAATRREVFRELGACSRAAASRDERVALRKRGKQLEKGIACADSPLKSEGAYAAALEARRDGYAALVAAYETEAQDVDAAITGFVNLPRLREAALWQSAQALRTATHTLTSGHASTGERRNAAGYVAMLVQRYATKNDSFAFYGPVGWGELTDDAQVIASAPGQELLAHREVYFEGWAIDALVEAFNQNTGLKPWCSPRALAGVWIGADAVYTQDGTAHQLPVAQRLILEFCDGRRTAHEIAGALVKRDALESAAQVYDALRDLVRLGLVSWELEVAPQLYPERELAERLARIGDAALRAECERALRELTSARDRVALAAGDCEALDAALAEIDEVFTRLTGAAASRRAGKMYAARGLLYQDCRRDYEFQLGTDFLDRIGPALSVVLDGARWVATELRAELAGHMRACYTQLRCESGAEPVSAHQLFERAGATGETWIPPIAERIRRDAQQRWATLLDLPVSGRRVVRSASELRERSRAIFACDGPTTWGRYFAPDLMVACADLAAFRRGEFTAVLGELHSGNTLLMSPLISQHPAPARIAAALAADSEDEVRLSVQVPKARWIARLNNFAIPTFCRYEFGQDLPSLPARRSLPAGALVVDDGERGLRIASRNGDVSFDATELFVRPLMTVADGIVSAMLGDGDYCPRITIDHVTINREQWRVNVGEMPFLEEKDDYIRFAKAREWARQHGFPRRVFYRSPKEPKPCYLDFDSPLYVGMFTKLMRHLSEAATIRIVEMLPDLHDTWLEDADGAGYTSELRLVVRDDRAAASR